MKNNQLTLLRDIKTVDQLIIKLHELGYTRADDFEEEGNEWGDINKYCVSRDEELPLDGITQGEIVINPKSWLNDELANYGQERVFVDFSTKVNFDYEDNLFEWSICYVEMGELWDIDINSVYIEKLDKNLIEFIDVADEKLDKRIKQRCEEKVRRLEE
ncbi:hypothetical protein OAZ83_01785 [Prochlorococcus sp. AH-736-E19]|nr:hypothetical protein [Prochlorococcus sp. AH-736-E19]